MITDKSKAPKLLLDEQIWVYLATLLREQGFDVIHVYESDLEHKPDSEILRWQWKIIEPLLRLMSSILFRLLRNISQRERNITTLSYLTKFRRACYKGA